MIRSQETWLRPNRRALALGMIVPMLAIGLAAWLLAAEPRTAARSAVGAALLLVFGSVAVLVLRQLFRPRIAYCQRRGLVLFYLQSASPIGVPVEVVEGFFVAQQPLEVAGRPPGGHASVNLVARLSRRATEWHVRDVKPALGRWTDGYVAIHGAWCEPLDGELIRRLNQRLRAAKSDRPPSPPKS